MKYLIAALMMIAAPVTAQQASNAPVGVVRVLDKSSGKVTDLEIPAGAQARAGLLNVTLRECRYPAGNPAGDAFASLVVEYRDAPDPVFQGWMVASSPALNPLDHPRYDVWVLRCKTA